MSKEVELGKILNGVTISGDISATSFSGDGSNLTNLPTSLTSLGIDNHDTVTVDASGNVTATSFAGDGSNLTGISTLDAISASITATAVDVFVYDTSKDSDGGAWRKRCQHTSWYNETLNTATRGSRREFPAVAVIVADAVNATVTIYDGDAPSLPMWMVFEGTWSYATGKMLLLASYLQAPITSVAMKNGKMVVGAKHSTGVSGAHIIDFLQERCRLAQASGSGYNAYTNHQNIADRNKSVGTNPGNTLPAIVSGAVNDVAMTVLPDAPTDPATGLPVPTIAVATDGGVSVIKDSGDVYDSTSTNAHTQVDFYGKYLFYSNTVSGTFTEIVDASNITADGWTASKQYGFSQPPFLTGSSSFSSGGLIQPLSETSFVQKASTSNGISIVGVIDYGTPAISGAAEDIVAYTTSSYATGWMNGDIKLAALADTTAETFGDAVSGATVSDPNGDGVYDGEHFTNGDFPSGLSDGDVGYDNGDGTVDGWTIIGGELSVVSGSLRVTDTSGVFGYASISFPTVVGKTYLISVELKGGNAPLNYIRSGSGVNSLQLLGSNNIGNTPGTYEYFVSPTTTTTYLTLISGTSSYGEWDNISVRLADPDRSVNGKGLAVHGSITKAPVATGADVVAYSGFSASNYLEQPYNPDLDFGTGDFCVMGWVKTAAANTGVFFSRGDIALSGAPRWWFGQLNGVPYVYSNLGAITATGTIPVGSWSHVVFLRLAGVSYFYTNGTLVHSATNTQNLTNTAAIARLGQSYSGGNTFTGSLALWRISGTAPTADQIAKIYEDEKVLFQEGAKATLYGTSDAVTALAHDPVTDLLHVGTSSGRSVFQGLRRVDNTTTAVGTAISASGALVVEE